MRPILFEAARSRCRPEPTGEVEGVELIEADTISIKDNLNSRGVGALGLGQLVNVSLRQMNRISPIRRDANAVITVFKPAKRVDATGAGEFTQHIYEAGPANTFRRAVADHAIFKPARRADLRARLRPASRACRGILRPRRLVPSKEHGQNPMFIAQD